MINPTERPAAEAMKTGDNGQPPDDGNDFIPGGGDTVTAKIRRLLTPICEAESLELVFIEFQREHTGRVLRVYLDKEGGTSIEDCARVSRQTNDLLDVYFDNIDNYTLEVSSAGINRPLGRLSDFVRFAGRTALIKTDRPVDGRKRFKGVLLGLVDKNIEINVDGKIFSVPGQTIKKAQLVNDDGVKQW